VRLDLATPLHQTTDRHKKDPAHPRWHWASGGLWLRPSSIDPLFQTFLSLRDRNKLFLQKVATLDDCSERRLYGRQIRVLT